MEVKIELKESFLKMANSSHAKPAKIFFDDGRRYEMSYVPEKNFIEITMPDGQKAKANLTEEERCKIIEKILIEYTTFIKSIMHFSIAYSLEQARLVDLSYDLDNEEDYFKDKRAILLEYMDSQFSRTTSNVVLKETKRIYDTLINKLIISKNTKISEVLSIPIEEKISKIEMVDIRYYLSELIKLKLKKNLKVIIKYGKERRKLLIEIEELD